MFSDYCESCYEGDHEYDDVPFKNVIDEYDVSHCVSDTSSYSLNETTQLSGNDSFIKCSPVVLTSVHSLQNMSSVTVAVSLWNHLNVPLVMEDQGKTLHSDLSCLLYGKVLELLKELTLPNTVAEKIVKDAKLIRYEIKNWISYHFSKVFFHYKTSNILYNPNYIRHFVWHPNGKINCRKTAVSLLTCDRLSNIEKYRLLCLYCLKDEIEIVGRKLFTNHVVDYVKVVQHPLIFYWNCHFYDTVEKILVPEGATVDSFMFNHPRVDNWSAKEYFFSRLSLNDQIQQAISFIDKCGPKYQKLLISKLDESQRLQLFMVKAVKIVENYASSSDHILDVVSVWHEVKNLISGEQFVLIFQHLLNNCTNVAVLKDIWIDASDDFKFHLLNHNEYEIIAEAIRAWVDDKNDIFFTLISHATASFKKSITTEWFFPRYCVKLMSLGQLPMLDKLLNVCLPCEKEAVQFKTYLVREDFFISYVKQLIHENNLNFLDHLLNLFIPSIDQIVKFKQAITQHQFFHAHCEKLIVDNNFTQLDALLNSFLPQLEHQLEFKRDLVLNSSIIRQRCLTFYTSGNTENFNNFLSKLLPTLPNLVVEYKKALILSNEGKNTCINFIDTDVNLSNLIADSLPPEMVPEYIKELIFAPSIIAKFNSYIRSNQLSRVVKCVDRYLTSADTKKALKKLIIGNSIELMRAIFRKYDETVWDSVLMWWLEDEETIYEFSSALPLDNVFDELLKDCIFSVYDPAHRLNKCKFRPDFSFDSLDRFLNWYFETHAKVREYKLHRVDSYMEIDTIKTLLKKKDDKYLKAVMHWFFEANHLDIDKFKMKNRGRKILNFV